MKGRIGVVASGSLWMTLALTANASPPSISFQPQNQSVILYQQAALGVTADGTPPLHYQWLKNGASIPGATNDEFTVPHARLADEGQYSVVVSDNQGMATSSNAELTVRLPGSGDIDFSFGHDGIIGAGVHKIVVLPDGRLLVGGQLADDGPIARLQADGLPDPVFMNGLPNFNEPYLIATVYDILPQANGGVVISGTFRHANGTNETYLARLNPDGTIDPSFSSALEDPGEASYTGEVLSMLNMPGGKILIGGAFYEDTNSTPVNLARINSDGSIDPSFQTSVYGSVTALAAQSNGQVLVGGGFISIGGISCSNLVRLNADGTLDTTFKAGIFDPDGSDDDKPAVASIAIQSDGKILVAGTFKLVNGIACTNLARLNPDGSLDESFNPDPALAAPAIWAVNCITVQSDGKILAGSTPMNSDSNLCVRLNSDGSLDSSFRCTIAINGVNSQYQSGVFAITPDQNGKILIGVNFATVDGVNLTGLARLNADGTLDTQFAQPLPAVVNGPVYSVKPQDNGKILIGGNFTKVNGEPKRFLAQLESDGSLDQSFTATPDSIVTRMAIQPDGKILIAGCFTNVDGVPRHGIARLLSDGGLDTTFQNGLDGIEAVGNNINSSLDGFDNVLALAIQSDSRILVAGNFETINGVSSPNLARLNPDGSLDTSFRLAYQINQDPTYEWISSIAVETNGEILIGGYFWADDYASRRQWFGIARLETDGSLDTNFYVSADGQYEKVWCLGLQTDGKILMGCSDFYQIGTSTNPALVRLLPDGTFDRAYPVTSAYTLHILPDDSLFTAGTTISKFDSNGILVTNFSNSVSADNYAGSFAWGDIEMDPQGKALVAGGFTKMNGAAIPYLARLWTSDHPSVLNIPCASGNNVNLTWHAISNRTYRVQYADDLLATNWIDLPGDVCATNDLAGKADVMVNHRYYRVRQLP
ncbi:MAG TPA: immunoglobulin domain-containing protein [Verrucomicrobiae bacterium]|jgi:uncharacterized delta-60 repeat protein|nr:immunoglobulin domain-containing protein [Verrucomicrobiae bacterium]